MRSSFYYEGHYRKVASNIKDFINPYPDFLSLQTAGSPRAVGDAIESLVAEKFDAFLGSWCSEYSNDFARRAMADLAFTDTEGVYSVVDVKTHREDTRFNMPNLTSVERLSRFYESDMNVFSLIIVRYSIEGTRVTLPVALNFYPYMRSLHEIRGFQAEAACGSSSLPVRISHMRYS